MGCNTGIELTISGHDNSIFQSFLNLETNCTLYQIWNAVFSFKAALKVLFYLFGRVPDRCRGGHGFKAPVGPTLRVFK